MWEFALGEFNTLPEGTDTQSRLEAARPDPEHRPGKNAREGDDGPAVSPPAPHTRRLSLRGAGRLDVSPSLAGSWPWVQSAAPPPPIFASSLPTLSSRWPPLCSANQREGPIVKMMSRDGPGKGGTERAPHGRAQSVCTFPLPRWVLGGAVFSLVE